ncbi:MAG: DUF4011 domain-containing protein [Anaerolineae bacterium]
MPARARTLEEQGVNVLFVAFGVLHWIDPLTKENAQSPLLLVPAALTHEALRNPYTLAMLEDDLVLNPTLIYKLRQDFGLDLPDVPDDIETSGVTARISIGSGRPSKPIRLARVRRFTSAFFRSRRSAFIKTQTNTPSSSRPIR